MNNSLSGCQNRYLQIYTGVPGSCYDSSNVFLLPGCATVCPTIYRPIALPSYEVIPTFLTCGYQRPCITCDTLNNLVGQFRTIYPSYNGAPFTDTVTITAKQLQQNSLLTRFLNYRTGFNKTAKEYLAAFKSCIGQTSIEILCGFAKPANDISDIYTVDTVPCRAVQTQSAFIAQLIYQQRKDSLIANFDSLYKAKCLGAKYLEQFYNSYTPKEYHYTLYYYDQAGNLVKTLPPLAVKPNFSIAYLDSVKNQRNIFLDKPNYKNNALIATEYRYNSLNQVVVQKTPDAGTSNFWYDRLGRLALSQNAKQATGKYSYTVYDPLGRIIEVGQKPQATLMKQYISQDTTALKNWMNGTGVKEQITLTSYDSAYSPLAATQIGLWQQNLRNRVSYTYVKALDDGNVLNWDAATFYSYDIHGNVDTLLQDYRTGTMNAANNRFKRLLYCYDLISGKVNDVAYQAGWADQFYHHYEYDAENKLIEARTSKDKIYWEREALYDYYRHGPLARVVLGQNQVQGVDYGYTIQGWLKGVNSTSDPVGGKIGSGNDCGANSAVNDLIVNLRQSPFDDYTARSTITFNPGFESNSNDSFETFLNASLSACTVTADTAGDVAMGGHALYDMGKDGYTNSSGALVSVGGRNIQTPDAYGFSLNYFTGDYKSINGSVTPFAPIGISDDLFNGNINAMSVNIPKLGDAMTYGYGYDQLNRLVAMDAYSGLNSSNNNFNPVSISDYKERLNYDPNGKIVSYARWGKNRQLDNATYNYYSNTNRLEHIADPIGKITDDVGNQAASNYQWDAIGEMIKDSDRGLNTATWTVYGKIQTQTLSNGTTINYTYDAGNNRISKTVSGSGGYTEWYVRDASGNVMSIYRTDVTINGGALTQTELHIYGSNRLGILNTNVNCTNLTMPALRVFIRGNKLFELTEHRGNVILAVSDKRLQHTTDNTTVDYYNADVVSAQDYSSFGALLDGRQFGNTTRFTYNGKQLDKELGWQDYGMREYLGGSVPIFASIDPITKKYPELTPYQFASNRPIDGIDIDGLEYATFNIYVNKNQKVVKITHTTDYKLGNGSEGPGVKYVIYRADEGNRPDDVTWSHNLYGIYVGGDNPRLPQIGADVRDTKNYVDNYDLKPIDENDANGLQHDHDFDDIPPDGLKGFDGVMDERSTKANEDFIKRAKRTVEKYKNKKGEKDDITGQPVTKEAAEAAAKYGWKSLKSFRSAENLKKAVKKLNEMHGVRISAQ